MPTSKNTTQFKLPTTDLATFLTCLGIGTLHAIREDALSSETAIWSLGAPKFWEPFLNNPTVPQEIVEILQTVDELPALQQLAPEAFTTEVDKLIDRFLMELKKTQDPTWQIEWIRDV